MEFSHAGNKNSEHVMSWLLHQDLHDRIGAAEGKDPTEFVRHNLQANDLVKGQVCQNAVESCQFYATSSHTSTLPTPSDT